MSSTTLLLDVKVSELDKYLTRQLRQATRGIAIPTDNVIAEKVGIPMAVSGGANGVQVINGIVDANSNPIGVLAMVIPGNETPLDVAVNYLGSITTFSGIVAPVVWPGPVTSITLTNKSTTVAATAYLLQAG